MCHGDVDVPPSGMKHLALASHEHYSHVQSHSMEAFKNREASFPKNVVYHSSKNVIRVLQISRTFHTNIY